jgi:hypothetical protein
MGYVLDTFDFLKDSPLVEVPAGSSATKMRSSQQDPLASFFFARYA